MELYLSIYTEWVQGLHPNLSFSSLFFGYQGRQLLIAGWSPWLGNAMQYQGLSIHSFSAAILPEPRPPILLKEPTADKPLKLLLPSLKFLDFLDLLSLEELTSPMSLSASLLVLILATASRAMPLLQKGQTGAVRHAVVGFGLLWQHRASVHWAHIWWPQSWTSIVHTWSKHMQQSSVSLACKILSNNEQLRPLVLARID